VPTDDDFEHHLPGALRAAVEGYPGPSPDLVRRGIARGRQQRRARVLRGAAVAAVLTVSGVAAVSARLGAFDGSAAHSAPANEQSRPPTATVSPPPHESPAPEPEHIDLVPLLRKALGTGTLTDATGTFDVSGPRVTRPKAVVSGQYTVDGRTTSVSVEITRPVPGSDEARTNQGGCLAVRNGPAGHCESVAQPDGTHAVVWSQRSLTLPDSSLDRITVVFPRGDGGQVSVTSGGERLPSTPGGGTSVPQAPGGGVQTLPTKEQLIEVARSPVWDPVVDKQPLPNERLLSLVPSMLPSVVQVVAPTGDNEHARFALLDTQGRSELTVDVLANSGAAYRGCTERADVGSCRSLDLPDGTRLVTTTVGESAGGVGDQTWETTAYHPNGLRVLVGVTNSPDGKTVLRATPSLSLDQLEALAGDSRWS
jgi:hypothetical protein